MSGLDNIPPPGAFLITVDGQELAVHPGVTLAAALLGSDNLHFRDDRAGRARGPFCNMGTCSECMAWVACDNDPGFYRRRLCLVPVSPGMRILTREPDNMNG